MQKDFKEVDILVVGAGPGGLSFAIAAARQGAKVMLVEKNGYLGGQLAMGLPLLGYLDRDGNPVVGGIAQEFIDELKKLDGASDHFYCPMHGSETIYDDELFKIVAFKMAQEAGIDILLYSQVIDVNTDNGRIDTVTVFGKSHKIEVKAKIYVDATGDGDVGYMAGAHYEKGNHGNGQLQPPTLMCTIEGVDVDKVIADVKAHPDEMELCPTIEVMPGYDAEYFSWNHDFHILVGYRKRFKELRDKGLMPVDRDTLIYISTMRPGTVNLNCTRHCGIDGSDVNDLTKATIEGHYQNVELVKVLRQYFPGFENARITRFYPFLGVRESRRFEGIRTLTEDDVMNANIPEDSVGLGSYMIDIHASTEDGTIVKKILPYGLPYGMSVSSDFDNLMFSGRCASMDSVAMSSLRVMPPLMVLGEGAGVGAALAIKKGIDPAQVDPQEIRTILRAQGVQLEEIPNPCRPAAYYSRQK
ncbi:MAG: FAD-dependent oxidoreductase [Lachnospiraceae bacterium]|nr:FAD-dependent oxidoreductase [Candidatus Minthocola equi]